MTNLPTLLLLKRVVDRQELLIERVIDRQRFGICSGGVVEGSGRGTTRVEDVEGPPTQIHTYHQVYWYKKKRGTLLSAQFRVSWFKDDFRASDLEVECRVRLESSSTIRCRAKSVHIHLAQLSIQEQSLHRSVLWSQGGLVFEAHRLSHHST